MAESDPDCPQTIDYFDTKEMFDKHGFAGPFSLEDKARVENFWVEAPVPHLRAGGGIVGWHMNSPSIQNRLSDTKLREMVTKLCGSNLVIWRSAFFVKKKGASEIRWHHDKHFPSAGNDLLDFDEISTHFSVLFALDYMGMDNGRLELIPGSHKNLPGYVRDRRPIYEKTNIEEHFITDIPPELVNTQRSVFLDRGKFLVFHSGLIHRSLTFSEGNNRRSLALRLVPSDVTVPDALHPFIMAFS